MKTLAVGIAVLAAAFVATCLVYLLRRSEYPSFKAWWDAEGVPIFIVVWLLLMAFTAGRGWLGFQG